MPRFKFRAKVLHPDPYGRYQPGDWVEGSLWESYDGCWINALEERGFKDPWVHVDCTTIEPLFPGKCIGEEEFIKTLAELTGRDLYTLWAAFNWLKGFTESEFKYITLPDGRTMSRDEIFMEHYADMDSAVSRLFKFLNSFPIANKHVNELIGAAASYLKARHEKEAF